MRIYQTIATKFDFLARLCCYHCTHKTNRHHSIDSFFLPLKTKNSKIFVWFIHLTNCDNAHVMQSIWFVANQNYTVFQVECMNVYFCVTLVTVYLGIHLFLVAVVVNSVDLFFPFDYTVNLFVFFAWDRRAPPSSSFNKWSNATELNDDVD